MSPFRVSHFLSSHLFYEYFTFLIFFLFIYHIDKGRKQQKMDFYDTHSIIIVEGKCFF